MVAAKKATGDSTCCDDVAIESATPLHYRHMAVSVQYRNQHEKSQKSHIDDPGRKSATYLAFFLRSTSMAVWLKGNGP